MFNLDTYAELGAKFSVLDPNDPNIQLAMSFLNNRQYVAEAVAKKYPIVEPLSKNLFEITEGLADGQTDLRLKETIDTLFELIEKDSNLMLDIDFLILLGAHLAFAERGGDEGNLMSIGVMDKAIQLAEESNIIGYSNQLICAAMWFINYNGYQQRVYQNIERLKQEGWYDESEKRVLINGFYWLVIKEEDSGKRLLFISEDIICLCPYNLDNITTPYESSLARKLLDERTDGSIITSLFKGHENILERVVTTEAQRDRFFLPDVTMASNIPKIYRMSSYYNIDEKRYWYLASIDFSVFDRWWLSTAGDDGDALYVDEKGVVAETGAAARQDYGIRPCFWAENSDGFFDGIYVNQDEFEKQLQRKREAYIEKCNAYNELLNRLGDITIGLDTKMKDFYSLTT